MTELRGNNPTSQLAESSPMGDPELYNGYKTNPDMPYIGINGNKCYNNKEIAQELIHNADAYSAALREWNAPLYIYFAAHGDDTASKYQPLFKTNPWAAVWRLAYTLCPDCEFPFWSLKHNGIIWCATIDQLIEAYSETDHAKYTSFNIRTPIGRYMPMLITDECFQMWLEARDPSIADRVRYALDQEKTHGNELYAYIFYLLDPERNYFYQKDTVMYYTKADIGALINQDMIDYLVAGRVNNNQDLYSESYKRYEQLARYRDTKLYYYLKSKGMGADEFEFIDSCFDLHSNKTRTKSGPYNSRIATLKACQYLAGETKYYFPISNITIRKASEIADVPIEELREELHKGFLLEWLAVQYQENPNIGTTNTEGYEQLTLGFMDRLREIDPEYDKVRSFDNCRRLLNDQSSEIVSQLKRITRVKTTLWIYVAIITAMIILMIAGGVYDLPNEDKFNYNWQNMVYIAVPIFVLMIIPPVQSYVSDKTKGMLTSPIFCALLVANIIVIGWEVLRLYVMPYSYISLPIIFGIIAIWIAYYNIRKLTRQRKFRAIINPDFETSYSEPLRFVWHESSDPYREFRSSIASTAKDYNLYLKGLYRKLISALRIFTVWLLILIATFCMVSKLTSNGFVHHEAVNQQPEPNYEASVTLYINDADSDIMVYGSPDSSTAPIGSIGSGELIEVIGNEGQYTKILYDGDVAFISSPDIIPLN